jgi:hypothetical protein
MQEPDRLNISGSDQRCLGHAGTILSRALPPMLQQRPLLN